jgi:hypothetical protein
MFYFIHSALRGVQSVYTYNLNDMERTRMEGTKFGPDMQAHQQVGPRENTQFRLGDQMQKTKDGHHRTRLGLGVLV